MRSDLHDQRKNAEAYTGRRAPINDARERGGTHVAPGVMSQRLSAVVSRDVSTANAPEYAPP
jgi:hypothetical protein